MGRLTYETTIHHFSHPHPLHLSSSSDQTLTLTPLSCAACSLPPSSSNSNTPTATATWIYSCKPCNFHLDLSCSQLPPLIHHPSHPTHPLTLLPTPVYPEGYFNCDACANTGAGFSYRCAPCGLDIHTACASLPLSVNHYGHVHPLTMAFFPPYDNKGFSCDVCGSLGGNHWLYRCALCEFDVHLGCGARPPPPVHGVVRVGSGGAAQMGPMGVHRVGNGGAAQTGYMGLNRVGSGGGMMVGQAMRQIGKGFAQGLLGGVGGGGGGGGGGGSGDSDNGGDNGGDGGGGITLDVGSVVIGSVFGGGDSSDPTQNN